MIEARLAEAKRLLACSNQDIKEIAACCGWDDSHYFSRIFKRKTGIPPIAYRLKCNRILGLMRNMQALLVKAGH